MINMMSQSILADHDRKAICFEKFACFCLLIYQQRLNYILIKQYYSEYKRLMNLRDKRPTNYYKELCQQMPSGRDAQKNEIIGGNITQKRSGNMSDMSKQDKNNHKTAQLFVKLIKSINRQFSKLSSDDQKKVKEQNQSFDIQTFASNINKVIGNYKEQNIESDNEGSRILDQPKQGQKVCDRSILKLQNKPSAEQIRRRESQNQFFDNQLFNFLKQINPIAAPLKSQNTKKYRQKTTNRLSPKMKIQNQQSSNNLKRCKSNLGNEYSEQCYKTLTNTLIFQEKMKKQSANTTVKPTKNTEMNENTDVLRLILEKKGSIGSQKLSTFFQLKRSSFHVAIAYRIYLLQLKKQGSNFQKFQELDPTIHSRRLKKKRELEVQSAEGKSKLISKQ